MPFENISVASGSSFGCHLPKRLRFKVILVLFISSDIRQLLSIYVLTKLQYYILSICIENNDSAEHLKLKMKGMWCLFCNNWWFEQAYKFPSKEEKQRENVIHTYLVLTEDWFGFILSRSKFKFPTKTLHCQSLTNKFRCWYILYLIILELP